MKFTPYSFSKLSLYNQCPRKFKYRYIDKIKVPFVYNEALLKGGAVHSILEHHPDESTHKLANTYKHIAQRFLKTELANQIFKQPTLREFDFGLSKKLEPTEYNDSDALFRGSIDCIFKEEDQLVLIDFKTGKLKDEKYQSFDQLMFYSLYFFQKYKELQTIKISYVYVEHENAENYLVLERKYLNNYVKQLIDIIKLAETEENFNKNITPLCGYCDYKDVCEKD